MSDTTPGSRAGTHAGHYYLQRLLGQGGTGEVYQAVDTAHDRPAAVKLLSPALSRDPAFRQWLQREAPLMARISEPHVVPVREYFEADGLLGLDMPLIEATDLAALLRQSGPLPAPRAVSIIWQVAAAVDAAHAAGVIHRGIRGNNVLVTEHDYVYLVDFGIAGATVGADGSVTGGRWNYCAPELFSGAQAGATIDVYALACLLYQCLTGVAPYPAETAAQLADAHRNHPAPPASRLAPAVPAALDAVIATGLAKAPEQRYRTAGELARAAYQALSIPDQHETLRRYEASQQHRAVEPAPTAAPAAAPVAEPTTVLAVPSAAPTVAAGTPEPAATPEAGTTTPEPVATAPQPEPSAPAPEPAAPSAAETAIVPTPSAAATVITTTPPPEPEPDPITAPQPAAAAPTVSHPVAPVPASPAASAAAPSFPETALAPLPEPARAEDWAGPTPDWAPAKDPGNRKRLLAIGAAALVVVAGGFGWLANRGGGHDSSADAGSTSEPSTPPAVTMSAAEAQAQLQKLLPAGYAADACTPSSPLGGALAEVTCGKNTDADGPPSATYTLFPDVGTLRLSFDNTVQTVTVVTCPGRIQSPGAWHRRATPDKPSGMLLCGKRQDLPTLVWSNDETKVIASLKAERSGPTLEQLYSWWSSHS